MDCLSQFASVYLAMMSLLSEFRRKGCLCVVTRYGCDVRDESLLHVDSTAIWLVRNVDGVSPTSVDNPVYSNRFIKKSGHFVSPNS
jgi:hypothetical protein